VHVKKISGKCSVLGFIFLWNVLAVEIYGMKVSFTEFHVAFSGEELCHISVLILDSR